MFLNRTESKTLYLLLTTRRICKISTQLTRELFRFFLKIDRYLLLKVFLICRYRDRQIIGVRSKSMPYFMMPGRNRSINLVENRCMLVHIKSVHKSTTRWRRHRRDELIYCQNRLSMSKITIKIITISLPAAFRKLWISRYFQICSISAIVCAFVFNGYVKKHSRIESNTCFSYSSYLL